MKKSPMYHSRYNPRGISASERINKLRLPQEKLSERIKKISLADTAPLHKKQSEGIIRENIIYLLGKLQIPGTLNRIIKGGLKEKIEKEINKEGENIPPTYDKMEKKGHGIFHLTQVPGYDESDNKNNAVTRTDANTNGSYDVEEYIRSCLLNLEKYGLMNNVIGLKQKIEDKINENRRQITTAPVVSVTTTNELPPTKEIVSLSPVSTATNDASTDTNSSNPPTNGQPPKAEIEGLSPVSTNESGVVPVVTGSANNKPNDIEKEIKSLLDKLKVQNIIDGILNADLKSKIEKQLESNKISVPTSSNGKVTPTYINTLEPIPEGDEYGEKYGDEHEEEADTGNHIEQEIKDKIESCLRNINIQSYVGIKDKIEEAIRDSTRSAVVQEIARGIVADAITNQLHTIVKSNPGTSTLHHDDTSRPQSPPQLLNQANDETIEQEIKEKIESCLKSINLQSYMNIKNELDAQIGRQTGSHPENEAYAPRQDNTTGSIVQSVQGTALTDGDTSSKGIEQEIKEKIESCLKSINLQSYMNIKNELDKQIKTLIDAVHEDSSTKSEPIEKEIEEKIKSCLNSINLQTYMNIKNKLDAQIGLSINTNRYIGETGSTSSTQPPSPYSGNKSVGSEISNDIDVERGNLHDVELIVEHDVKLPNSETKPPGMNTYTAQGPGYRVVISGANLEKVYP
jgi:hypothetical protein